MQQVFNQGIRERVRTTTMAFYKRDQNVDGVPKFLTYP
jgi:hypothetical protein